MRRRRALNVGDSAPSDELVIEIELDNRSGLSVDDGAITALCRRVLAAEGIEAGDLGIALVPSDEIATQR